MLTDDELRCFERDGYLIARNLAAPATWKAMRAAAEADLRDELGPVEYEADLHYPGAPTSKSAPGGRTVRRLLRASERDPVFRHWATSPAVVLRLRQLLGPRVALVQAHHNCIMTKQPRFSSETGWHQDIRYWSFSRPDLVSVWLALGQESTENGCLRLLPGTHRQRFARERLDDKLFLRPDLPENQDMFGHALPAVLEPGDALFFHALTFHAADRNRSNRTKFSLVFTYRALDNTPQPGTRSAATSDIIISD
jgi:phytanoyl-CoA hydroxylase